MPLPPTSNAAQTIDALDSRSLTEAALDIRRKRLRFRAWHRGIREMDLIMGRFADREIAGLDDGDLDVFEALLEEADDAVYSWIVGRVLPPEAFDTPLFSRIRVFEHAAHPLRDG